MKLLYPPRCPICDGLLEPEEQEHGIHPLCVQKLYPVEGAVCMRCGRPLDRETEEFCLECRNRRRNGNEITQGKALFLYQGAIKETMYRFKYSNKREYADFFAEYTVRKYGDWIKAKRIQVVVPVPMHRQKKALRGYNQAESFAKALSQLTDIPVDTEVVRRVKDTVPQKELNDVEREKNLENAFQPIENIVQYKRILVVDDIYTTGSTARAVASALNKGKDCQVYFMSICIGRGV